MRRSLPLIVDFLFWTALAVWLGGMGVLWLAQVPTVNALPAESSKLGTRMLLESMQRFTGYVEIAGLSLAAIVWVARRRYQKVRRLFIADGVRTLLLTFAFFLAEYSRYVVFPNLKTLDEPKPLGILSAFAMLQTVLLWGFVGLTVWLQAHHPPSLGIQTPKAPPVEPTPTPTPQPKPATPTPQPSAKPKRKR